MSDVTIDNVIRSQIVEDYLDHFENKDIEAIKLLLSDDCSLTDWNCSLIEGKEHVVEVYEEIFRTTDSIRVEIQHLYEDPAAIICEMVIFPNEKESGTPVVDIIRFDEAGLIKSVAGYMGFVEREK